jgi:hypothetical protein
MDKIKLKKLGIKFNQDILTEVEETFGKGQISWIVNFSLKEVLKGDKNELRENLQKFIRESKE